MLLQRSFFIGTTKGNDVINIGHDVRGVVRELQIEQGLVTVLARLPGAAIVILKGDANEIRELKEGFDKLSSPLRNLFSPVITIPIERGRLACEPWQELYLLDYDPQGRRREVVAQFYSETSEKGEKAGKRA